MMHVKKIKKILKKSPFKASVIVVLFMLCFLIIPLGDIKSVYASLQDDLNSIQNQINETNQGIEAKKNETATLTNAVSILDDQIQQTILQIQQTETEITLNTERIAQTEEELRIQKEVLNEYLRVIYEESNVSALELIASSNSFSEFVDRSEYLQTMQIKIKDTVEKIKKMKAELEAKKKELLKLSDQLNSQKNDLSSKRATQANLLAITQEQQAELEKAATGLQAKRGALYCQIYGGCGGDINGNLVVANSGIYYSQKQDPWGPKEYTPGYTMWEYGCLITSYAMVKSMLGNPTDPWQEAMSHSYNNNGEMNNGNAPPGEHVLGVGKGNIDWNGINRSLDSGKPVIVQYNWVHFIVLTGHSGNTYQVNDPYFPVGSKYDSGKITKALGY